MLVRRATLEDVSSIAKLEESVASPWSEAQIAAELTHSAAIVLVLTAAQTDTIAGWCSLRLMAPEAELLKIAVHQDHRRTGLGEQLLREALKYSATKECREIFLEVRATNHPARNFYRKIGFEEYGIRKNYYKDPCDDAILYRIKINSLANQQSNGAV